ncbi:uncharacterized protein si:dkey-106l3.7 [Hippoglossus hippoglossus]|uniref:uncharacterized protein si:dkey-106l3.7 n=1 Tax=Hippoglossus hippoglossus TaxID=8267 RepID=UPI00148D8597|nr:uncharacterized protein si:dkey-106l3.7 [Hippoglossus hippoglossus]
MNLYRSFGNLMEAWVNEGGTYPGSPTPPSDTGPNFRSESVDSGVETASTDTSFPALSSPTSPISADNAEIDAFIPEATGLTPTSTSLSPVLSSPLTSPFSSSSPSLCPSKSPDGSRALQLKVEQALQRTDSKHQKDNSELLTVEEVLRRQPRASSLAKRHSAGFLRGQRSESFGPRKTLNQSASLRQTSETCRRPISLRWDKPKSEELGEEDMSGPSPGLCYLEQVCQMLENIARQQIQNRALRMEVDALREQKDVQAPDSCHTDCEAAEEDGHVENEEHSSSEAQQVKRNLYGHFRQRSSSETMLTTLHLRQIRSDCRGQHLSTDVLQERIEEEHLQEESTKKERNKTDKNWRTKFSSFRREEPFLRDTKGQQMQSSEKNSARRRLSQLFRRRKPLPVFDEPQSQP